MNNKLENVLADNLDELVQFRRNMHSNPELSFEEVETTANIKAELNNTNFEVYDLSENTGLIGLLNIDEDYKTIGFRADIDALPINEQTGLEYSSENENVMHACGHDIHTSILLGFCKVISELKDELKVNVAVIFQPAEEIMGGAKYILDELEDININIDELIAYHTWPYLEEGKIGYRHNNMMAGALSFDINITASGGHAAHPHTTADPIFLASNAISFIQSIVSRYNNPVDPLVITVGQIHGGNKNNIISDKCSFGGTIRSFSDDSIKNAENLIKNYISSITELSDAKYEIDFNTYCPPLINDEKIVNNFKEANYELTEELSGPSMGSEDFAFYLKKYKGALLRVGTKFSNGQSQLPLHNSKILFSEEAIPTGVKGMANYVLQYE